MTAVDSNEKFCFRFDTGENCQSDPQWHTKAEVLTFLGITLQLTHVADATTSHSITNPTDSPATADALRDNLVASTIPDIKSALDALGTKINVILDRLESAGINAAS